MSLPVKRRPPLDASSSTGQSCKSQHLAFIFGLPQYVDCGYCSCVCQFCGAYFWYVERVLKLSTLGHLRYNHCCRDGGVVLPYPSRVAPEFVGLYQNARFLKDIRAYNSMFSMTSFGSNVDEEHMVENRFRAFDGPRKSDVDFNIVQFLVRFLGANNEYVWTFKTTKLMADETSLEFYAVRLFNNVVDRRYELRSPELPLAGSLGCIVSSDDKPYTTYAIIIFSHSSRPQRISKLHPSYMPLQYPLLFPYGEEGWSPRLKKGN
ncbi:unnamed protein product [Lactuca saligna]|uniref:Uncharacterized protein n=1 Tax=Lactuca saligna TaxID=75948 RepID=A0AA35YFR4_LACSI|nr:unnamed protein product [Lactuca saligna]